MLLRRDAVDCRSTDDFIMRRGRSNARLASLGLRARRFRVRTGVTAPVWCRSRTRNSQIPCLVLLPVELTTEPDRSLRHNPYAERLSPTEVQGDMRRWPSYGPTCLKLLCKDAGGSRTHFRLLCRQPPRRLAPASDYDNVLSRSRTWSRAAAVIEASLSLRTYVGLSRLTSQAGNPYL